MFRRWTCGAPHSAACGANGLCIRFIKLCLPSISHVIAHIANSGFISHYVPAARKVALFHSIQKSSNSTDVTNYQPISILPTIAKIVERIVYEQLFYYFAAHHLFSASQHGLDTIIRPTRHFYRSLIMFFFLLWTVPN